MISPKLNHILVKFGVNLVISFEVISQNVIFLLMIHVISIHRQIILIMVYFELKSGVMSSLNYVLLRPAIFSQTL